MGTVMDTNKLKRMIRVAQPPEAWLNRLQRKIRQEQISDRTLGQDFVTPVLCHMSIEVVSVRVREHQHEERISSGVVSWTDR